MIYRQSVEGCLSAKIGDAGLAEGRLAQWLTLVTPRFKALEEAAQAGSFAHFRILSEKADIEEATAACAKLSEGAETVVMFGTGGSSLGGQALAQLGGWSIPGGTGKRPELRFCDNLDARSFMLGLRSLDIPKTRFIAISKSGTTGETLAQVLTAFKFIEDAGHASLIPALFLGVTEPEKPGVANGLRSLFAARGIPMLAHSTEIGGRYSAFTNVGLLPALACGLDVAAFRAGGLDVVRQLMKATMPEEHPAAIGAATAIGLAKDLGVINSVMMPYSDRLERFSAWYVQLWAESLGKGGKGTTPIATLGPVDQHSQLQLFMDGPPVHFMTVLRVTGAPGPDDVTFDTTCPSGGGWSAISRRAQHRRPCPSAAESHRGRLGGSEAPRADHGHGTARRARARRADDAFLHRDHPCRRSPGRRSLRSAGRGAWEKAYAPISCGIKGCRSAS